MRVLQSRECAQVIGNGKGKELSVGVLSVLEKDKRKGIGRNPISKRQMQKENEKRQMGRMVVIN